VTVIEARDQSAAMAPETVHGIWICKMAVSVEKTAFGHGVDDGVLSGELVKPFGLRRQTEHLRGNGNDASAIEQLVAKLVQPATFVKDAEVEERRRRPCLTDGGNVGNGPYQLRQLGSQAFA
jgi:hypothetical protein